jgi:glycosyltransferase involved in cell wall biosynthesis
MPAAPTVDVILPTHRRPHTIAHSIAAVLAQTHADLRLHVVGDGCDERTADVVAGIRDPRLTFHRFPKGVGFGYAHRNAVLRRTDGEYVAYPTDDDLWFPDHLERGLAEIRRRRLGLVAFRSCHVLPPDLLDPYSFAFDWKSALGTRFLRHWFMGSVNCVHHRAVFDTVGFWNDGLFRFGDRDFYNRVRLSSVPSAYVDEITVLRFYAQHWDRRYETLCEAPQRRYLEYLRDPEWRESLRRRAAPGPRPLSIRRRQWADFFRFAIASGPKFLRFWWQRL